MTAFDAQQIYKENIKLALIQVGVNFTVSELVNSKIDQLSATAAVSLGAVFKSVIEFYIEPKKIIDNIDLLYLSTALVSTFRYAGLEYLQNDDLTAFDIMVLFSSSLASQKFA